jgi:hypothetical protein
VTVVSPRVHMIVGVSMLVLVRVTMGVAVLVTAG